LTDVKLAPQALERLPAGNGSHRAFGRIGARLREPTTQVLKTVADQLPPGDHHLRPSTLEDVFLKATGRRLDARQ
jgi:hypothetical protein